MRETEAEAGQRAALVAAGNVVVYLRPSAWMPATAWRANGPWPFYVRVGGPEGPFSEGMVESLARPLGLPPSGGLGRAGYNTFVLSPTDAASLALQGVDLQVCGS